MSVRTHNFRIGLVILVGACLFVGALFALGLQSYFGKQALYETYVPGHIENLSVGALVKLRGVTIGKVTAISFIGTEYPQYKEDAVIVRFEIPRNFRWSMETNDIQKMLDGEVARGLRARVQSMGFVGASFVSLEYVDPRVYPVEPVAWTPKHYYIPSAPNQFNHVVAALEKTLGHVENLDLADTLARANKLIDAADRLMDNINQVNFGQLGTNANSLVVELRESNRDLQRTLSDAQGAIKGADLAGIRRDTGVLEARLSATALDLRRLLESVDIGDVNSSLANVRDATDELIVLLHALREQPSTVLFSKPPKPDTELADPPKK